MFKPDAKILDDLARVAGGAINIASGLQQQIRDEARSHVEAWGSRMDFVPREDFERLEMTVAALKKRIEELEKSTKQSAAPKKATTKKPSSKGKKAA